MKIDRNKLKKTSGLGLSPPVAHFINELLLVKEDWNAFATHLSIATNSWNFGKTELCHWVDVLDVCDEILEEGSKCVQDKTILKCDVAPGDSVQVTLNVLGFIGLLFEHSFSRHLFNSAERLLALLNSCCLEIVVAVLQVLYVFSKRSNYLLKISTEQKSKLISHLECLAENWGGKESGMSLAQCCARNMQVPPSATQVHLDYEILDEVQPKKANCKSINISVSNCKSTNAADMLEEVLPSDEKLNDKYRIPLFTRLRLASNFVDRDKRLLCVMARLQAISILVYSSLMREEPECVMEGLVYPGFLDECVQVLKLDDTSLADIKTEMLKMLCSIIYLDRSPKLHLILEVMNASSYHGFLPSLVRSVIASLRQSEAASSSRNTSQVAPVSTPLAIALFSFIYHMAGYDNGAEALVRSGMTESLLSVIQWEDCPLELITFVTRSVRVLDLISFNDVQSFQSAGGIQMIVNRLVLEVDACRDEQPFSIKATSRPEAMQNSEGMSEGGRRECEGTTPLNDTLDESLVHLTHPVKGVFCPQQRSVLIKSLLNFLKKALQEQLMADGVRRMMDGSLPKALKHIISNPEYYGPPLFLNALTVTTNFIYQEPGQLTALQDKGLTDVIMQALLDREVPALRDVVACVPTAFSALCLNERGLQAFNQKNPFHKFLKLFTSTKYLSAIKKKKGIDQRLDHMDTAMSLGTSVDELMRHQPTLKEPAMKAIVELVKSLADMANNPLITCLSKAASPTSAPGKSAGMSVQPSESSDDDDEDIEAETGEDTQEITLKKENNEPTPMEVDAIPGTSKEENISLPLVDFIHNTMKFLEAIFGSVAPGEHAKKFVEFDGVTYLAKLLNAQNLPSDFGQSSACSSLANVVKLVVNQSQDVKMQSLLMDQIFSTLNSRKEELCVDGSKYLQYLMNWNDKVEGKPFADSVFMRELGRTQAQLMVLVQLTKQATAVTPTSANELRKRSVNLWTSHEGLSLMRQLAKYQSEIVWDQCLLLALCSYESSLAPGEVYAEKQVQYIQEHSLIKAHINEEEKKDKKEVKKEKNDTSSQMTPQLKAIVHLVQKTGRELSDLLSLQMRLCIGQMSRRRGHTQIGYVTPGRETIPLARSVCLTLKDALSWKPPSSAPSKLRFTYLIYVINQLTPLLFENRRNAYHVMLFKMYETGAHRALFHLVQPILNQMKEGKVNDGVEELLESWLCLVERLCNPSCIVDSHFLHSESSNEDKMTSTNSAKRYLLAAHRDAFIVVKDLWDNGIKLKSTKVVEAALNVLSHVLRSEKTIKESDKPEKEERKTPEQQRREMEEQISPEALQQLTDMGFSRTTAIHALYMCGNVETAAEWLLSQPPTVLRTIVGNNLQNPLAEGANLIEDEEEQLQRALALSMQNGGDIGGDGAAAGPATAPVVPHTQAPAQMDGATHPGSAESDAPIPPPSNDAPSTTNGAPLIANGAPSAANGAPSAANGAPSAANGASSVANGASSTANGARVEFDAQLDCIARMSAGGANSTCGLADSPPLQLDWKLSDARILDWIEVRKFADDVLVAECFAMLDTDSNLVYRIADCLSVAITAFGQEWDGTVKLLKSIIGEIMSVASSAQDWMKDVKESTCTQANSLFSRLHLLCLLFEELRETCITLMAPEQEKLIELLSDVLYSTVQSLSPTDTVPKYVTALLLWFDLHERAAVALYRKQKHEEIIGTNRVWKYWDNGWNTYQPFLKAKIEAEYVKGAPSVKFESGRNRYILDFSTMTQINLDSSYERHVIILKDRKKETESQTTDTNGKQIETQTVTADLEDNTSTSDTNKDNTSTSDTNKDNTSTSDTDKGNTSTSDTNKDNTSTTDTDKGNITKMEQEPPILPIKTKSNLNILTFEIKAKVMESCVGLLSCAADCLCIQAVLRICLRLSRDTALAADFVQMGGLEALLALKQEHSFPGINNVLGLIVRHILEDCDTLRHTMEKVVRAVVSTPTPQRWGQQSAHDAHAHDLYQSMRTLGPLACRETNMFKQVFIKNVMYKVKPDETNATNMVCVIPGHIPTVATLTQALQNVLKVLVNYLTRDLTPPKPEEPMDTSEGGSDAKDDLPNSAALLNEENKKSKDVDKNSALIPKSAVLRLLGELVRSYSVVSSFLAENRLVPHKTSVIKEEVSLIGYLLDHLLVLESGGPDSLDLDCPSAVKVLMSTLASSNHSPDAQNCLIVELKNSLHGAMISPESNAKHQKLIALVSLVGLVKDSCPNLHNSANTENAPATKTPTNLQSNNMLRLIARKRVLLDLARIPLCLDLTSPQAVATLNAVLKTLDDLTRLINAPQVPSSSNAAQTIRPTAATASAQVIIPASITPRDNAVNEGSNEEAPVAPSQPPNPAPQPSPPTELAATATSAPPSDSNTEGSEQRSMVQHLEELFFGAQDTGDSRESYDNSTSPFNNDIPGEGGAPAQPQHNHHQGYGESATSSDTSESVDEERHEDEEDSSVSGDENEDIGMEDIGDEGAVPPGEEVGNEAGSEHSDYDEMEDAATAEDYEEEEEEVSDYEEDYENYGRLPDVGLLDGLTAEIHGINAAVPFGRHRSRDLDVDMTIGELENALLSPSGATASSAVGLTHPLLNRPIDSPASDSHIQVMSRARRTEPFGHRAVPGQWLFGLQRQGAIRQRQGPVRVQFPAGIDRHNHELAAILQRLYGPGAPGIADDFLNLGRHAGANQNNRFYISEEDYMRREAMEDYIDEGPSGRMVVVSSVPGALNRWTEECRLLEGDSVHKLVQSILPEIEAVLDVDRQKTIDENLKKRAEAAEKAKLEVSKTAAKIKRKPSDSQLATDPSTVLDSEMGDNPWNDNSTDNPGNDNSTGNPGNDNSTGNPWNDNSTGNPGNDNSTGNPGNDNSPGQGDSSTSTAQPTEAPSSASNPTPVPVPLENVVEAMDTTARRDSITSAPEMDTTQRDSPILGPTSDPVVPPIEPDPMSNITNASGVTINSSDGETNTGNEEAESSAMGEAAANVTVAQEQSQEFRELLGDMEVPEGVDPAFLAALPENMRREVIDDHLRRQRVHRLRQQQDAARALPSESVEPSDASVTPLAAPVGDIPPTPAASVAQPASTAAAAPAAASAANNDPAAVPQISPEFLDALPPELQEEVLTQQRAAQQAVRPQQDDAFDATAFLDTLTPSLRQQVLAEADDTQIQALPANLAAEARRLRGDLERRQMQRLAQGMYRMYDPPRDRHDLPMAYIDRVVSDRAGVHRYTMRMNEDGHGPPGGGFGAFATRGQANHTPSVKGQQLLDREALTGLLTLFFVSDPKLNHGRLHRILKSVCHHPPTRDWLIRALISILDRLRKSAIEYKNAKDKICGSPQSWLNLTVSTGLGGKAPVFSFTHKPTSKKSGLTGEDVIVHPQASSSVCLHVLDTLISLAKSFPGQFVPIALRIISLSKESEETGPSTTTHTKPTDALCTDFWNILIKLDSAGPQNAVVPVSTPMKSASKVSRTGSGSGRLSMTSRDGGLHFPDEANYAKLNEAPLGRLMSMLDHPVILENTNLMERTLRLLHSLLISLPEDTFDRLKKTENVQEEKVVLETQLHLAVDVVTERKCTNEAYWNAYNTLIECVRKLGTGTQLAIKRMLLDGARKLGKELETQIGLILDQLTSIPKICSVAGVEGVSMEEVASKGVVQDRYTGNAVVVSGSAPTRGRNAGSMGSCLEMQLPGMDLLTANDSVQHHLLRTLNTVIKVEKEIKDRIAKLEAAKLEKAEKARAEFEREKQKTGEDSGGEKLEEGEKLKEGGTDKERVDGEKNEPKEIEEKAEEAGECSKTTASLSEELELDLLWTKLSDCLGRLDTATDPHAVLVLQPAAEAFFVVHAAEEAKKDEGRNLSGSSTSNTESQPFIPEMQMSLTESVTGIAEKKESKLVQFALRHRRVLNQILRQSENQLMDGPFAVLIDHPRLLDFDVKRQYFKKELARQNERTRLRREDKAVHVRRNDVFQDSFRELHRLSPAEWKCRLYIIFQGEEGQDAGGLLREWYAIITREIFNPNYALFTVAPGDKVTFMINPMSHINIEHLDYFKFVGHLIAKAVYDNKQLDCYFTRAFYKHILNKPVSYQDIESEDPQFFQSLEFMRKNSITGVLDLRFASEVNEFGTVEERELKSGGKSIEVTDENKEEYVRLTCQMKMTGAIRKQLQAFLEGFYDIIPKRLISIFNEQELELLISGLPTIDIDDLQKHTDYFKYTKASPQIRWFWRALRSFEPADVAKFLQFVTGTSKVPLQGFGALEGMGGVQKFSIHMDARSTERLPSSHTCFNQLDLPAYETYEKLREQLLTAIRECTEGFGFA